MKITINPKGGTQQEARATFSPDEVQVGFQQVYLENVTKVKIPGFRPGKAPFKIYAAHVGLESLKNDYVDFAVREVLKEMLKEKQLAIVGQPQAKIESFPDQGPLDVVVIIYYIPDFELPDPKSFKIEVPKFEVTDEAIDKAIENMRARYATMEPIEKSIDEGDFVYFKWSPVTDGRASDNQKEELVEVGKEHFVKGFDKNLIGAKNGDVKRIATELSKGKEQVEIEINIGQVKQRNLPPLDNDFAKTVSFETVDALKQAVRAELDSQAKQAEEEHINSELAKNLIEKTNLEIPQNLVDAAVDDEIDNLARELARKNLTVQMYINKRGITEEKLREELTPKATNQSKLDIILDEFARKNQISVSNEEIKAEMEELDTLMKQAGKKPLEKDSDRIKSKIASMVLRRKTVQLIRGQASLT